MDIDNPRLAEVAKLAGMVPKPKPLSTFWIIAVLLYTIPLLIVALPLGIALFVIRSIIRATVNISNELLAIPERMPSALGKVRKDAHGA